MSRVNLKIDRIVCTAPDISEQAAERLKLLIEQELRSALDAGRLRPSESKTVDRITLPPLISLDWRDEGGLARTIAERLGGALSNR